MATQMANHIMLSYQWDKQDTLKKVYATLSAMGFPVWMDIEGGMSGNINDSMAFGVDNAAVVCCFMTEKYEGSKNCKKELNYTDGQNIDIVPCMAEKGYKAKGWLGIITAGMLWIDFRNDNNLNTKIESLAKELVAQVGDKIKIAKPKPTKSIAAPKVNTTKNPGRAFIHKDTKQYLAETGTVKTHAASGSRSTLAMVDKPEDTSYWVEERQKGKDIVFYKNYVSNKYLGYDPNGDYIYTKAQHYGAEEWILKVDEEYDDGKRNVVLWAAFGKKYLAIRDGKLTGVSKWSNDCVWVVA